MRQHKHIILITFLTLSFAGFIGYFIYTDMKKGGGPTAIPIETNEEFSQNNTSVAKEGVSVEIVKQEGESVKITSPIPDLNRAINIPASTPHSQKEEITSKINALVALLKQDPDLFNEWLNLGLLRKSIEDYEGARQAWEYASSIRPQNSLSFGNLALLYGYYLKNPVLAEKNYLKAIENDLKLPYLYAQAADFYLEVLNQPEKAREILQKGLQMIPGDLGLQSALENL